MNIHMMESRAGSTRERLARFCEDVRIESPASFRIGEGPAIVAARVGRFSIPGATQAEQAAPLTVLCDALAVATYSAAYARIYVGPGFDLARLARSTSVDAAFVASLEAANPSRAGWEAGWRVFACDPDGCVHVAKGDIPQKLLPGRFAMRDVRRMPRPGDEVERRRESSSLDHQPGLYHAFGEAPRNDYDDARLARFYFDVEAADAAWVLATVATTLNRFAVPFTYKCPVDPASYDRLDAGVLYVARRHVPTVMGLLSSFAGEFEARLGNAVPLWTKPVLPGIGAADDPNTGESFGQSRSSLVAAALVEAWATGRSDLPSRLDAVTARFRRAGLTIDRSHLNAGSADIYATMDQESPR